MVRFLTGGRIFISVLMLQVYGCSLPQERPPAKSEKVMSSMEFLERMARKSGHLKAGGYIEPTFQKNVFAVRGSDGVCPVYYLHRNGRDKVNWTSNDVGRGWKGAGLNRTAKMISTNKGWGYSKISNNLFEDTILQFGRDSYVALVESSIYFGRKGGEGKRVLAVNVDSLESLEVEKKLSLSGIDFNLIPFSATPEGRENVRNVLCSKSPYEAWQALKAGKKVPRSSGCTFDEKAIYDAQCMLGGAPVLVRSDGKSSATVEDMIAVAKEQDLPDVHIENYKMGVFRRIIEESMPSEVCKSTEGGWVNCKTIVFDKNRYNDGWLYSDGWYDRICGRYDHCENDLMARHGFMLRRKIYFAGAEVEQVNFSFDRDRLALIAIELRDTEAARTYLTRVAGAPRIVTDYQVENKSIHTVRPIMIGGVATVEHDFYPTQSVKTSRIYQWSPPGYYAELEGNVLKIAAVNRR